MWHNMQPLGGSSSGYGLTLKDLRDRSLKFESCNEKRLENNFIYLAYAH